MKKIEKILFPSDLTSHSLSALEYAVTFSKLYNAKLYILHVFDNSPYENLAYESYETDKLFFGLEENARIEMNRYIREKLGFNQNIVQVLKCGSVKEEIIKFTEKEKIDLVVLAADGKSSSLNFGHDVMTEKVLDRTNVPVVTINQTDYVNTVHTGNESQINIFGKNFN